MPDSSQPALWGGPARRPVKRSRRGVDQLVRALRKRGALEDPDALLVSLLQTLADDADRLLEDPDKVFHHLTALRQLAELEDRIHGRASPAIDDDDLAVLMAIASGSAPPGDTAH